ncbi:MAG: ACT domain-containing protein [Phycisphaeraceae bacterium]
MGMTSARVPVWAATIDDRPGGLAEKLDALSAAGANLEFIISRRDADNPGKGVLFVTPIEGDAVEHAAKAAGFAPTTSLHSVRVMGGDRPGLGAQITWLLADAGLNLRGLSAAAIGDQSVVYLAFDSTADASQAIKLLAKI